MECPFKQTCLWSHPTILSLFRHLSACILKRFAKAKHLTVCPLCVPVYLCLTPSDPMTSLWCHSDFGRSSTAGWILAVINIELKKNYLEAIFELLGDKVEDYGIDAGVDGCHVDAKVVKYQQKTATTEGHRINWNYKGWGEGNNVNSGSINCDATQSFVDNCLWDHNLQNGHAVLKQISKLVAANINREEFTVIVNHLRGRKQTYIHLDFFWYS